MLMMTFIAISCHIGERLKLEGEMENMGVCTKERKGGTAEVLMATPCTNSFLVDVVDDDDDVYNYNC